MKENKKGLAIAIIVLLIGASVIPSISGVIETERKEINEEKSTAIIDSNVNPTSITMDCDKDATAMLTDDYYTLYISVIGCGWVDTTPPGRTYPSGTVGQITAMPCPCWEFAFWSGDMTGSDNPTCIIMDSDMNITAHFWYTFPIEIVGCGYVIKEPNQSAYPLGDNVELTAIPDEGWEFAGWSGDISSSDNPIILVVRDDMIEGVIATFVENTIVSIQPSAQDVEKGERFNVGIYVEPSEPIIGVCVDIYFDPTLIQADHVFDGDPRFFEDFYPGTIDNINGKITGIAGIEGGGVSYPGYLCYISFFAQQTLGTSPLDIQNVLIADKNGMPLPSTVIDGEVTVTEYFTLTILYAGDGSGTVDLSPAGGVYKYGTTVTLTANPNFDSDFIGWSGDLTGSTNPDDILMDGDKEVTATFVENTIVSIQPPAQDVEKGEEFTVGIYVEPSELIMGAGVEIYFDPTLIQANSVFKGDIFGFGPYIFWILGIIDNINGKITDIWGSVDVFHAVSDPGYFCNITFTAQDKLGTSPLDLQNVGIADKNGMPLPSTVIDGEVTVTEYFTLTILYAGDGSGTVDLSPAGGVYKYGTTVTLTANPNFDSDFIGWSGDLTGSTNPDDITMDGDKTVTANFDFTNPPEISNILLTTSDPLDTWPDFGWENVTCTVTDDGDGVDEVKIVITDPDMVTTEHLMIKTGTDTYYYNTTLTIVGEYSYYIWANDTANNIATTTPETFIVYDNWDINRDGEIRLVDFVLIAGHYGENGPPGWIREDVNNDGKIRLTDFVLVAGHYGE